MLISELEAKLKELREKHGDLSVYFNSDWPWEAKNVLAVNVNVAEYKDERFDFEFVCLVD